MPQTTDTQLANRLNPTSVTYNTPTTGLWRGSGDTQGDAVFKTNADGTITQYQVGGAKGVANLKSQYGLDFFSLPAYNQGDTFQAAAKAGKIRPNSAGTGYEFGVNIGNLSDFAQPNSAAGTAQTTVNATPNKLGDVAGATAAQTQQLAGDQGMNVTQTTTPEGVSAVQKTPLGTPAAQTQNQSGVSTQTPSTTGAAAGAPINYNKLPTETIDQYNARIAASGGPIAPTGTTTGASGAVDKNYQIQPGETLDSYNARISQYNAAKPVTQVSGQPGASGTMAQTSAATGTDPYQGLDPIQKQVKMFTDAYKALGLNTIKQQFDDYAKEQEDVTNKMNDEIANTRNNPWLSQGVADKTVERIKDKYATRLDTLTHLLTLTDSLYKQGQAQVDHMVSDANADIKATNDLAQKQLDAANALAKDNQVIDDGTNQILVNKQTGKQVAILGPSVKASNTLADKEALAAFNASLKTNNPSTTSDITNYNYAKSSGYTGTFQQWLQSQKSSNSLDALFGDTSTPPTSSTPLSLYDQANSVDFSQLKL